jgi:hypothetical protein
VDRDELPELNDDEADAFLVAAKETLATLDWGIWEKEKSKKTKKRPAEDSKWQKLNSAALANLEAWVPELFPEAEPSRGGYRVTSAMLNRDLEEDLSIMPESIKDFGIHDMGDEKEGRRTPIDIVVEYGKKPFIDAVIWLRQRLQLPEGVTFDDFRAYMPAHNYIFAPSREPWPASSVNARLGRVPLFHADGTPRLDKGGNQETIPASTWLDQNQSVEQMTWAPGLPMLIADRLIAEAGWIERPGVTCFNLYRPPTIVPGDASLARHWLWLVYKVFSEEDAKQIIIWCAQRVQFPEIKINHALVLGSEWHGIGKDTILEPLRRAVGPWNFKEITPQRMLEPFNGFLKSVVLRVSEARDLGEMTRHQFYDHTKIYTASPPDSVERNEKHLKEHQVLNCLGMIITTNYKTDGIYLPAEDRRHYVAWSDRQPTDFKKIYWTKFWNWLNGGGDRHVAAYLATLDISAFDPKAPPTKTAAFWEIVNANRAPEDAELADAIDSIKERDAITITMIENYATDSDLKDWIRDRKNRRAIPHRMGKCGYVPVRNDGPDDGLWKIAGARQVVYARAELTPRERYEAAQWLAEKPPAEAKRRPW